MGIETTPDVPAEVCVTCAAPLTTAYCAACGERRASDRRYSLGEFAHEALEAFLSFDGRAVRTFKRLLMKPGELTAAYMRGVRLPYLTPLNCFLVANLIYFIWATFSHSNTFSTTLHTHTHNVPYAGAANRAVIAHLAKTRESDSTYAVRFDAIGRTQAKSLVLAMVPAFAVVVWLVTLGRARRFVVQHLTFALHTYAYIFCLSIIADYVVGWPLEIGARWLRVPLDGQRFDDYFSSVLAIWLITYLVLALRRAYGFKLWRAVPTAVALLGGIAVVLAAYRGLLFVVTFAAT